MAYTIEKTGKSIEEAVRLALEELQCDREEAEIEVLAEPSKGLLGIFGAKEAKVRVWKKEEAAEQSVQEEETVPDAGLPVQDTVADRQEWAVDLDGDDKTAKFILDVTGYMGIEANLEKEENEDTVFYSLNGQRMGTVIGRRGETLDALQYLTNIVAGKEKEIPRKRVVIDAEDYRQRREETLVRLATRLAAKAKKSGRRVVLEPMNPQERRVIHTTLEGDTEVRSISEGEDPYRRLVIYPILGEYRGDRGNRNGRGNGNNRYEYDQNDERDMDTDNADDNGLV